MGYAKSKLALFRGKCRIGDVVSSLNEKWEAAALFNIANLRADYVKYQGKMISLDKRLTGMIGKTQNIKLQIQNLQDAGRAISIE